MIRIEVSEIDNAGVVGGRIDGVKIPGQTMESWCEYLLKLGADPAALITMRWSGATHDSWVPAPLAAWAPDAVSCTRRALCAEWARMVG